MKLRLSSATSLALGAIILSACVYYYDQPPMTIGGTVYQIRFAEDDFDHSETFEILIGSGWYTCGTERESCVNNFDKILVDAEEDMANQEEEDEGHDHGGHGGHH